MMPLIPAVNRFSDAVLNGLYFPTTVSIPLLKLKAMTPAHMQRATTNFACKIMVNAGQYRSFGGPAGW
jgi:hypothetical protein